MEQNLNKITQYLSNKGAFGSQLLTISRETEISVNELRKTFVKHPLIFKKIGRTNRYAIYGNVYSGSSVLIPNLVAIFCGLIVIFIVATKI
jgi:hypothetical protein